MDQFTWDFVIKLFTAMVLSGAVGLERSISNKAAGFRTMMLICIGTVVFMELTLYLVANTNIYGTSDISRVVGQVITGIGFLGAGTIMRASPEHGRPVDGLTTAASIWFVAGLGLLIGLSLFKLAIISTVAAIIVLVALRSIEIKLISVLKPRPKT